jgi:hypothetical protein
MENEISKNEMRTLLNLIQRIEKFEVLYSTQNWAIERLIWGLLLVVGGILDYVILYFTSTIVGWFTTIAWVLIIVTGLLVSNFVRRNLFITVRKRKPSFYARTQFYWMLLAMVLIFIFGYNELDHFTVPVIAILIGTVQLVDSFLAKRKVQSYTGAILHYVTPAVFYLTAIINLIGFFVIGEVFEYYYGLIFGLATGIILVYGAYLLKGIVSRNKIDSIETLRE